MGERRFELVYIGPTGGDCTAPYVVKLKTELTVAEFVHDVLLDRREWGDIHICEPDRNIYSGPCCTYRYGELLTVLPDDVIHRKVVNVKAHGGWSAMDYIIYIRKEK